MMMMIMSSLFYIQMIFFVDFSFNWLYRWNGCTKCQGKIASNLDCLWKIVVYTEIKKLMQIPWGIPSISGSNKI